MTVRLFSLYSGSTGNAFLIRTGSILIDAGKSCKKLCQALADCQVSPADVRAIFVTHEHTDHIGALPVLLKKHPIPVHVLEKSATSLRISPAVAPHLVLHKPMYSETVCGLRISSFPTPHDSAASVGFRIAVLEADGTDERFIGYATDVGHVTPYVEEGLTGCDTVVLECNHDLDMLHTGPYPYPLKQRIASPYGHLSNDDSAALAARLYQAGTRRLMLAHLSAENNTPDAAMRAHAAALSAHPDVRIFVARPDNVTELCMEESI